MTNLFASAFARLAARACAAMLIVAPLLAHAQAPQQGDAPDKTQPPPEASSDATGWTTQSVPSENTKPKDNAEAADAEPPMVLSSEQVTLIGEINEYLNSLVSLEGRFVQTDHRNEEKHGKFYVHRPGRLRFDYASPSRLRIVADGEYLAIEDHDLKTVDKFPLDATPILLFLGKDVNLTRDAVILDMRQDDTAIVVTLRDKSGKSSGQLQLFFKRPALELYEWVITDAQGLDTRIQLADLVAGNDKAEGFFESSPLSLENLNNN